MLLGGEKVLPVFPVTLIQFIIQTPFVAKYKLNYIPDGREGISNPITV